MDTSLFGTKSTGKLIETASSGEVTHAFLPANLPASWDWPQSLWPLLVEARCALSSLNGTGKHLPNPELLLRPLQHREAQRSSSLEGTITDPEQQLLFQIEPRYPESKDDPVNALREVFNYARALRLRQETKDEIPLSLRLVKQLHSVLMDGVRGAESEPGCFRKIPVHIGRPARYVPPPHNLLQDALDSLEKYMHEPRVVDPLVDAFMVHYQFEAIHPFRDGNGRVGRLLLSVMIAEWCQLSNQWLYMSAYFDRNKDAYIDHLFRVSTEGRWSEWVQFCLRGVIEQAADTERRCERLLELSRKFHKKAGRAKASIRLASVIDELFEVPIVRIPYLQKKYKVTYPTADSDVKRLVKLGILKRIKGMRQKTYYSPDIRRVIFEDSW